MSCGPNSALRRVDGFHGVGVFGDMRHWSQMMMNDFDDEDADWFSGGHIRICPSYTVTVQRAREYGAAAYRETTEGYPDSMYVLRNFSNGAPACDWYPYIGANGLGLRFPVPGSYNRRTATIGSVMLARAPWRHHEVCKNTRFIALYSRNGVLPGDEYLTLAATTTWQYRMLFVADQESDARLIRKSIDEACVYHHVLVKSYYESLCSDYWKLGHPNLDGADVAYFERVEDIEWFGGCIELRENMRLNPGDWKVDWKNWDTLLRAEAFCQRTLIPREFRFLDYNRRQGRFRASRSARAQTRGFYSLWIH